MRSAEINFKISLNNNNIPTEISWTATDSSTMKNSAESIILSIWDPATKSTLSFDLWTEKMTVQEMNIFVFQTLLRLSDIFRKSANDNTNADLIADFAKNFGIKVNVLKKEN